MRRLTRRDWFAGVGALSAGWLYPWSLSARAEEAQTDSSPSPAGFRFVHMTDLHLQPELKASEGLAACLEHIQALDPKPDFILTGGDLIMDALEQGEDRSSALFDLLKRVFRDNNDIPVRHCLGNHDVFGWGKKQGVTEEHPKFGKKMYLEKLELESTFYTFDHKGWRFFVLDSVQPSESQLYRGGLDDPQMEWFQQELARKPKEMPAAVVTHIPFLTVTVMPDLANDNRFQIGISTICTGSQRMAQIFAENNIKLALSGHIHMVDEVNYRGVKFACSGAVSGRWWKGPHKGFPEGYAIIDIAGDGNITYRYTSFGWEAAQA
ncbi:MAG: metallophosphoesterase family protein [Thermogutta sp.]